MNRDFVSAPGAHMAGPEAPRWKPPVDVTESEHAIRLEIDLPGFNRDDIEVSMLGEGLHVKAHRAMPEPARGQVVHRLERRYGTFTRSFGIEVPVDPEVEATYEEGVLRVQLRKKPKEEPRPIPIQVR